MRTIAIQLLAVFTGGAAFAQTAKDVDLDRDFHPPARYAGQFGDYASPLKFYDGSDVKTAKDWSARRKEILDRWHKIMGPWPPLLKKPRLVTVKKERRENFLQHHVRVEVAEDFLVSAILQIPEGKGPFPAAVVTYYDAKTGAGLGKKLRDFGYQLTKRGFVTLSIGGFQPRRKRKDEARIQQLSFEAYGLANCHTVLAGMPNVDAKRIGVVGHSYGGKKAMFASCLYEKFACAAWSDGGIVFDEKRGNVNYWEPWYLGYEPGKKQRRPGIPKKGNPRTGAYKTLVQQGRDLHELHALMAPRPFLVSGGAEDRPQRWVALNHTIAVNKRLGYKNRVAMTNRKGHSPTPESNAQIYAFFERFLKPKGKLSFKMHDIGRPGGRAYGQTSLVDVDGDGDLDFITGKRGGDVWWFEYRSADKWVRHRIGGKAQTDVGGVAFDVNGDGLPDQISGATLYLHPGKDKVRKQEWRRIPDKAMNSHDHRVADIDGDGRLDLVAMSDRRGLFWYRIPKDPTKNWIETAIGPARHSGVALGDVDGDGDIDVVRADWWFENADGKGKKWTTHRNIPFPGKRYNKAGMATQSRLADIDKDGDLDLIMTDGETSEATVMWFANADGKGRRWKGAKLAEGLGALHSLAVRDFDNDGDLDIFTCEFHIGGKQRWFLFENIDGKGNTFKRRVILQGVEGHESVVGDVDGDGDLDICSKPWNSDRHVFVENLLLPSRQSQDKR